MVGLQNGLGGIAHTLVNLIATTLLAVEPEGYLPGLLGCCHRGMDGQQPQSGQTGYRAFDALRVVNALPQHLVAATDAYHHAPFAVGTLNGLRTAVAPQFQQVVQCCLGAGKYNDVGLTDVGGVAGIKEVDTRVALQHVEVGEVTDVAQQHHRHVHLPLGHLALLLLQADAVFLFDMDVMVIGYDTQHGDAANILQHLTPLGKQAHVAPELVDDDALDEPTVGCRL